MRNTLPIVRTFMDPDHHAVREDDGILETVQMLIREGVTGAPVVDSAGRVCGILTELECLEVLTKGSTEGALRPQGMVRDYMKRDLQIVTPEMDLYYVSGLFLSTGYRRFAVVEGERLVGVITRKDVLKVVARSLPDA